MVWDIIKTTVQWLFKFFKKHATDFRIFLNELFNKPAIVVLSVALLAASIVLGAWYWKRATNYEDIINGTLTSETESTPQSFKGLESFIFSNIPPGVDDALSKRPINPLLIRQFQNLQTQIQDIITRKTLVTEVENGIFVNIPQDASGDVYTEIGSDPKNDAPGYLFLPSYLIREQSSTGPQMLPARGTPIRLVSHTVKEEIDARGKKQFISIEDGGLATDVTFGRQIGATLQEMSKTPITDDSDSNGVSKYLTLVPVQVYVITTAGINRIFNQKTPHPSDLYGNQFPATTFFPARPYFWPTFAKKSVNNVNSMVPLDNSRVGDFFYVSKPYLDLGGSGIVVTLTKGLVIPGIPRAVICIDIQFSPQAGLYTSLEDLIQKLSGSVFRVTCSIPTTGSPSCLPEPPVDVNQLDNTRREILINLANKLVLAKETRSNLLGNIQVVHRDGNKIRFSLPTTQDYSSNTPKVTLMVADIDVNDYRRKTTWIALGAASCFVIVLSLFGSIWTSTIRDKKRFADISEILKQRTKEFEIAFGEVGKVMFHSPTPYLRLDSQDRIVDLSASFCTLLGVSSNELGVVVEQYKGRTFRSFCADPSSIAKYAEVEEKRRTGKDVNPYDLVLAKRGDGTVRVKVHGAAVPANQSGESPQTFGILVEIAKQESDSKSETDQLESKAKGATAPKIM